MSPPFPPSPSLTIDKTTARRFMFAHHHLWPPRQLQGKQGVRQYIRHVGGIQFDPINIVGRNPDLVLQSRVVDFNLGMLDELLYEDRQLLDGWDKMASIISADDWPYFSRKRGRMQDIFGVPTEVVMQVAPNILEKIRQNGPQSPLDFKGNEKTDWSWGPTKVSRAGLEGLYAMGKLGVHHRVNNRRYFDFIENLLPAKLLDAPDPNLSIEEYEDWHVLRRVGGMGLVFPNAGEHWYGIIGVKTPERKQIISRLVERGDLISLTIEEIPDKVFYIRQADMPTLEAAQNTKQSQPGAAFLAPLDNLLWNRKMNGWLFDFEYIWEVYKPKAKRQYGYYVLPVIYGDQFIARFDPAFDKKSRHLTIQNWWWEEGIKPDEMMEAALIDCLQDFVAYLNAQGFEIGEVIEKEVSMRWMKSLEV
ncbi:MAG: YcaQ family DNA glycosylase [Anaerolineales bacterium]|nr:YcaQ family DNA glycosylase [Chloroflexota bacterium]MBL6980487.1 YcaQ family DNA glycosylase [Anaerolineales bacterium]